jgi:hypothetical protein
MVLSLMLGFGQLNPLCAERSEGFRSLGAAQHEIRGSREPLDFLFQQNSDRVPLLRRELLHNLIHSADTKVEAIKVYSFINPVNQAFAAR